MKKVYYLTSPTCVKCKIVSNWWNSFVENHTSFDFVVVDTSQTLDEARLFGVQELPGFVVVSEEGAMLGKITGSPYIDDLEDLLKKV